MATATVIPTTLIHGGVPGVITVAVAGHPRGATDGVDTLAQTFMDGGETARMRALALLGRIHTRATMAVGVEPLSRMRRQEPGESRGAARTLTSTLGTQSAAVERLATIQAPALWRARVPDMQAMFTVAKESPAEAPSRTTKIQVVAWPSATITFMPVRTVRFTATIARIPAGLKTAEVGGR